MTRESIIGRTATYAVCIAAGLTLFSNAAARIETPLDRVLQVSSEENAVAPEVQFDEFIGSAKTSMMRAPGDALEAAEAGYAMALKLPEDQQAQALATALWLKSEAALRIGRPDDGLAFVTEGLAIVGDREDLSEIKANLILSQGRLAGRTSQTELAIQSFIEAHELFVESGNTRKQALALQSIGSIYNDAEIYERALEYFNRAAEVYDGDQVVMLTSKNNVGNILRKTGDYDQARQNFLDAKQIAEEMGAKVLVGRILSNIAGLETDAGNLQAASARIEEALRTLDTEGGEQWRRVARSEEANIALARGLTSKAGRAIEAGFDDIDIETTSLSFREMHEVASRYYAGQGDWEQAFAHQTQFMRLNDEAKSVAASSNLALAGAQFKFAEQQLSIERLRNEQLESAAKISEIQENERRQQMIIGAGSLVFAFIVLLGSSAIMNQRKVAKINNALRDTVDQLSTEIERREEVEAALITARDKAEAADRMKSTFLATMSHELRTPMNGILGFTEVLLSGDLTEDQREQIEIIDQSSGSLLTLINDILDISQLEAGKFKLRESEFDFRTTVENAIKLLRAKSQEKHLSLMVHIDPHLPGKAFGDEDRIRQIVLNLVGNAVKFTEKGAVSLRVMTDEKPGFVSFRVQDTGIGIPADKVDTLFDRFSQIDGSATRNYAGSGLGLAICKELVQAMEGEIGCSSVEGEGSVFFFRVPLFKDIDSALTKSVTQHLVGKNVAIIDTVDLRAGMLADMVMAQGGTSVRIACSKKAVGDISGLKDRGETIDAILLGDMHDDDAASAMKRELTEDLGINGDAIIGYGVMGPSSARAFEAIIEEPISDTALERTMAKVFGASTTAPKAKEAGSSAMRAGDVAGLQESAYTEKVLIVDDVVANRRLVECVLKQIGVTSVTAENGQEAVEMAETEKFGLVLMDVYMPVMGGIDACRAIREGSSKNAETPIYALTASASAEERGEAVDAGMQGVLTKPLDMKHLRATVAETLQSSAKAEKQEAV
ncbi:MAG: ATP-binding protein [Pseudomonadota bacterium]